MLGEVLGRSERSHEAHAIDEVLSIRDEAVMLETYARISCDTDNERKAYEIRVRAEKKYGRLRKKMPNAKGGGDHRSPKGESDLITRKELGVSKKQDKTWRELAAVPDEIFEEELAGGASDQGPASDGRGDGLPGSGARPRQKRRSRKRRGNRIF